MGKDKELTLTLLDANAPDEPFPPNEMAWDDPNGLLALGGDLSPTRLLNAYQHGIFPWYNPNEPIYWWSPDPRTVLYPKNFRLTRSLRKSIRNKGYSISFDQDFFAVIKACSAPRKYSFGTWITSEMQQAYIQLHELGHAHSVEVWNRAGKLAGGLYGVASGAIFSGESMFSIEADTSKIAFCALSWHMQHWGYTLIDCQIGNEHLKRLGSEDISRKQYLQILRHASIPAPHTWIFNKNSDLSNWQPDTLLNIPA